ncbi:RteC domain-containing protein [Niabella sp. CC-SYL272]|uniref:RteC domain-containing protein n=1 Tax=Niabella agricola TaxID=2891571 RepID=UPI001F33F59E|nr:RteC domain-containing protein [Niabella agricola]MCF3109608.1 RteC domain-containing protein [Niabella agricola]
MIQSAIVLLRELEGKLSEVMQHRDVIASSERAIHLIEDYLHDLREIFQSPPVNRTEEIELYKNIGPRIYAHLIYFIRLYRIESALPGGNKKGRRKLFKEEQRVIERYFLANETIYRYFRSADSFRDNELFVFQKRLPVLYIDESVGLADNRLCTPTGLKFARFIAYERLLDYLVGVLNDNVTTAHRPAPRFNWTSNKIDLVELIYALCYGGAVNHGKLEVKELADFFSVNFGIELPNIYRSKQEMYSRKNTTTFLDFLKKKFRDGMDDADDRYNR